jgi:hypothetical protein
MAKQYSLQELNEGWKYGLFTIEEVAENLTVSHLRKHKFLLKEKGALS